MAKGRRSLVEAVFGKRALTEETGDLNKFRVKGGTKYEEFVSTLGSNASDPKVKAFIGAGKLDNDENDDKFNFTGKDIAVVDLIPTQNEIDIDKSLSFPMKDPAKFIEYIKGDGKTFAPNGKIVTYNGKYIIDGHHRWSQVYACNKNAKISAVDIEIDGLSPLEVLKAVQAAIALQKGSVPTQTVNGTNLLEVDFNTLKTWVDSNAKDAFVAAFKEDQEVMKKLGNPSDVKEGIFKYIASNVKEMRKTSQPVDGAPKRDFMPQTDNIDWIEPLKSGQIDVKEPFVDPTKVGKEEVKESRNDRQLVERWGRLAGLIKD